MILILTTISNKQKAQKVGNSLLKKKLIACYNMFPVQSAYHWKGKIEKSDEVLMILKTNQSNFSDIELLLKKESGYDIPEVVALKPSQVNTPYLNWLDSETK